MPFLLRASHSVLVIEIVSVIVPCMGYVYAEDQDGAEKALRSLGRSGSNVFRTTADDARHIVLLQISGASNSEMRQLPQLHELRTLRLSGRPTNASLIPVGQCPQLRELYLRGAWIGAEGVDNLNSGAPLETLWLVEPDFSDDMARAIVKLHTLHRLIIVRPRRVGASALELLSHHPSLQGVSLMSWHASDLQGMAYGHIASIPQLRSLQLTSCDITADDLKEIARRAHGLRSLHLVGCGIANDSGEALRSLTALETLSIADNPDVTDRFLVAVNELSNLRTLDLGGTSVTPGVLKAISKCRNLESLGLSAMDMNQGTIVDFQWLGALKPLKSLDLRGVDLSRREMQVVAGLPELEVLACNPYRELPPPVLEDPLAVGSLIPTDDVLEPLKQAPKLKTLRLAHANLSNKGLAYLASMKSLRSLDCSSTLIDDDGADSLAQMQQLESIRCSSTALGDKTARKLFKLPRLRELDLGHTAISDEAFVDAGQEWHIRYLDLTKTAVTDRALERLGAQPELRFVILNETQVGYWGVGKMVKRNPAMYVSRQFEEFGPKLTTDVARKAPREHGETPVEVGAGLFIDGEQ